ncbi:hypothetical protein QBC38DRAFT_459252 [Podospora fimiseda]|uniref:N-acetyltransferase domain-containing protein n=1 Tax=Podospora fimiseda TaxID=252190 RepID=A0AAN7BHJ1_9PEZI|nr:hypothetical protein QBC38DRAFT_459252 [Podospora fimiseda]
MGEPSADPSSSSPRTHSQPYTISMIPQTPEGITIYLNHYRPFRLKMLELSPEAFLTTHSTASSFLQSTWESRLLNPLGRTFFATNSETNKSEILSSLTLWRNAPNSINWEITALYTLPSARRQGIAAALIKSAEDYAVQQMRSEAEGEPEREEFCILSLAVRKKGNNVAKVTKFYEKVGFFIVGSENEQNDQGGVVWFEKKVGILRRKNRRIRPRGMKYNSAI